MNKLQQLVVSRMVELDLSARRVAERSLGRVSYETIRNIVRGRHGGKVNDRIAEGLSLSLEVPVQKVYDAMNAPRPMSRWDWPRKFDRLAPEERRAVEEMAQALLNAYERGIRDAAAG